MQQTSMLGAQLVPETSDTADRNILPRYKEVAKSCRRNLTAFIHVPVYSEVTVINNCINACTR
jgi:hypothetical protein